MATLEKPILYWQDDPCNDPGNRRIPVQQPPPLIGDDFDWQQRDFESFQLAMLSELQQKFPERSRWTAADFELVLIDILASQLDQLSDMADRVNSENYLSSARRPESVIAWLSFINYTPWKTRGLNNISELIELYNESPQLMEEDKRLGPAEIRRNQKRMVNQADYATRFGEHPMVSHVFCRKTWNGSWLTLNVVVALLNNWRLDTPVSDLNLTERFKNNLEHFHKKQNIRQPQWEFNPTIRELLFDFIRKDRMAGQEVVLKEVKFAGITLELCIAIEQNYFQSEIRREIDRLLGSGPEGFFRPDRIAPGEAIYLSDIYQWVMQVNGVSDMKPVVFSRQKNNIKAHIPDFLEIEQDEIAVCNRQGLGSLTVHISGGKRG